MHPNPVAMVLLLLSLATKCIAHTGNYEIEGYTVRHYDEGSSIGLSNIKGICLGANGKVMILSETQLVEFDGQNFSTYTAKQLGFRNGHFSSFNKIGKHVFVQSSDFEFSSLPSYSSQNRICYTSEKKFHPNFSTLPKSFPRTYTFYFLDEINNSHDTHEPNLIINSDDGIHYFVFVDSVFYCFNRQSQVWKKTVGATTSSYGVWKNNLVLYRKDGQIEWIDKWGKLRSIFIPGVKGCLWNTATRQMFFFSQQIGIVMLDEKLAPKRVLSQLPPNNFNIGAIMYDTSSQILFMGNATNGLLMYQKNPFTIQGSSPYYSLVPYGDTAVLTTAGHIVSKKGIRFFNPFYATFVGTQSRTLYKNKNQYVLHIKNRLTTFDADGHIISQYPGDSTETKMLYNEGDSVLWVGDVKNTLKKINGSKVITKVLPGYAVCMILLNTRYALLGTSNGCYWVDQNTLRYILVPGTQGMFIRSLLISSTGNSYAGTDQDGIVRLSAGGAQKLPLDIKGNVVTTHCIVEDTRNRFWISSNNGLYCIPEKELLHAMPNTNNRIFYYYFGRENGLLTNEFNGSCFPCAAKFKNGEVAWPSMKGIVWCTPDSMELDFPANKLELKKVLLNEIDSLPLGDTINVPQEFNRIEMFLHAPYYGAPNNTYIEYNTGNAENQKEWIQTDINKSLVFTHFKPGYNKITFRLRKSFGENPYTYLYVTYYRRPKLYERSMFYPLIVTFFIVGAYILYKMRTQSLEKRNLALEKAVMEGKETIQHSYDLLKETTDQLKNKNRFQNWLITSLVHDLRGPLRFIKNYADIFESRDKMDKEGIDFLMSVLQASKGLYQYSEQLLQMLKLQQKPELLPEDTDFAKVLFGRLANYNKELEIKGIRVVSRMPKNTMMRINHAALSIIVQNLLDNTIKEQDEGEIFLHFWRDGDSAFFQMQDNGPGMPKYMLQKLNIQDIYSSEEYPEEGGLGMWLVLSMVEKTHGRITFHNNLKGLQVTIEWKNQPA